MTDKNDVEDGSLNTYLDYYYCDESKCVSSLLLSRKGGNKNNNNNDKIPTFMCYAEGKGVFPFACAEGYEGFVVENELPFLYEGKNLSYYTCCHRSPQTPAQYLLSNSTGSNEYASSSLSSLVALSYRRHCSNTIVIGNVEEEGGIRGETNLCDGNSSVSEFNSSPKKEYPRNMTRTYGHLESYMCCDELQQPSSSLSNNNNTSGVINFLDHVDCVPYLCIDIFDYDCISKNRYGVIETMMCKDNLYDDIFVFPKVVATNNNEIRFECCKAGTGQTETHVLPKNTYAFKLTYGIQLVFSLIALVFLLVLIISLLRPLVIKILKCKSEDVASERTPSASSASSQQSRSIRRRQQQQYHQRQSQTQQQQPYSSYNLYLVYLLLPDLVDNIFLVWRCSSAFTGQTFNVMWMVLAWNGISEYYVSYADAIIWTCGTANICMNAVIAFEVFKFLKNSFELVRDPVPTLRKVSLQAVGVYLYSIVLNFIYFFLLNYHYYLTEEYYIANKIGTPLFLLFTAIGPFVFLMCICIMIWKRGYIKTNNHQYKHLVRFCPYHYLFPLPSLYSFHITLNQELLLLSFFPPLFFFFIYIIVE